MNKFDELKQQQQAYQNALRQQSGLQGVTLGHERGVFWNEPIKVEPRALVEQFLKFPADFREAYLNQLKASAVHDTLNQTRSLYQNMAPHIEMLSEAHAGRVIEDLMLGDL